MSIRGVITFKKVYCSLIRVEENLNRRYYMIDQKLYSCSLTNQNYFKAKLTTNIQKKFINNLGIHCILMALAKSWV